MNYNILVCDDEKDILGAIEIYLKADGHNVFYVMEYFPKFDT